jgi:type II restriction enzyme
MKLLCQLNNVSTDDELFALITGSFKAKITQWNYFINWKKVVKNIKPIEKELNLLNYLIGKKNIKQEIISLIEEYPNVRKAFPILLAIRENSLEVLIDTRKFIYKKFNFEQRELTENEISGFADFLINSGFGEIIQDKKIKNIVDYATGVEVGLDSNGRKNRGGQLMEILVEEFVKETSQNLSSQYIPQATAKKIKEEWGVDIEIDKSSRIIDFVINKNGRLYFIETNFYGSSGSKLKSTAIEYIRMNEYWNNQGIEFIWITDGAGWKSTHKPLKEYFDEAKYLLNLEMLQKGILTDIVKCT